MADNEFDSYDQPSPQELQLARAYALRNQQVPDPDSSLRNAGLLGLLTGNKQLSGIGENLVDQANLQQQRAIAQPGVGLSNLTAAGKYYAASPQAELGGITPANYELETKREGVSKFALNPFKGNLFNIRTGDEKGEAVGLLDDDSMNRAADYYNATTQLPNVGGPAGALIKRQIIQRAALRARGGTQAPATTTSSGADAGGPAAPAGGQAAPTITPTTPASSLAASKAGYGADTKSLDNLQKTFDNVSNFEKTSIANLTNFVKLAANKYDADGIPILNHGARWFQQNAAGDPDIAAIEAARQVAVVEIAKLLNNPSGGNSPLSDSSRKEVQDLISKGDTGNQIAAVANVLVRDAANRKSALSSQISEVKGRIQGKAPAPEAPAPDFQAIVNQGTPTPELKTARDFVNMVESNPLFGELKNSPEYAKAKSALQKAASAAASTAAGRSVTRTINGETRRWDGKNWVPAGQ